MTHIALPSRLDGPVPQDWSARLAAVADQKLLTLNFGHVEFARPLGLLSCGREIRQIVHRRRQQRLITMVAEIDQARPAHSFLNHIGFFDFIGLPYAKPIGAARGSSTYVPIRRFTHDELRIQARAASKEVREAISGQAEELAAVLVGRAENASYWAVAYSVREVIRNVFEHSGVSECYVSAQKWGTGEVEMAVIDEGVGIRASLAQAMAAATDMDALREAIKPGVSRTMALPPERNAHDNSGFGLYVLSELGRCFGRFTLVSGSACLTVGEAEPPPMSAAIRGTAVGLKLGKVPYDFSGTLDDIVAAGETEAAALGHAARASTSSRSSSLKQFEKP